MLLMLTTQQTGRRKTHTDQGGRGGRTQTGTEKSGRLQNLLTGHYSLWSLLPSPDSSPSCGPKLVLRPRLPRAGRGLGEGEAARWRGDRGGGVTSVSGGKVLVVLEQVVGLGRPQGGGGRRADGAQVGPVGGGESGRALEQLPLPLLSDLSREEGRRVALQGAAGGHGPRGSRHRRRVELRLQRRQLMGRRLELRALGRRQQAVVGQAAVPRRLIGQAFVAGVCGAF